MKKNILVIRKKRWLFVAMSVFFVCMTFMQTFANESPVKGGISSGPQQDQVTIKGKVVDQDSIALPGISVLIKGTSMGAITAADGSFSLAIPAGQEPVLVFSFMGMKTQEIKFNPKKPFMMVVMQEDSQLLENVVVTGYQNIKESSFTGSHKRVTSEQLMKVAPTNLLQALQTLDPSFKMIKNNAMGSDPNTMGEYYIRGRSGISEVKELDKLTADDVSEFALKNNPSAPIFVMDGFEISMEKVFDMDPSRIAAITILKDAAATAVYGSRAANGVIVIETKAPEAGEVRISYSGTYSVQAPDLTSYDLLNAEEALEAERLAGLFNGTSAQTNAAGVVNYADLKNAIIRGIDTDWISKPLQTPVNHQHNLYLEGGSNELRWSLDLAYKRNSGVMKESARNTYGAGLTVVYNPSKKFQIRNRAGVDFQEGQNSPFGSFNQYVQMKPYLTPYDSETGSPFKYFYIYRTSTPPNGATRVKNPIYEATLQSFDKQKYKDFTDQLALTWYVNDYMLIKGDFSASFKISDDDKYVDPASGDFYSSTNDLKGKYTDIETRNSNWSAKVGLSYIRQFNGHDLNFNTTLEATESKTEATYAYYAGFAFGAVPSPTSAVDVTQKPTYKDSYSRTAGIVALFNYSYNNIYLFDLSGRLEGSSAFGADKKTAPFWATGFGLNVHNYEFFKNLGFVDQLKIRGTYGETGKANFSPYQAKTTYEVDYENHYANYRGMSLKALGNKNLKWEKVQKLNLGLDLDLFRNAFSVRAEYYHETTVDQVTDVTIRSSSGFTTYKSNMGEILNEGLDLDFNVKAIDHNGLLVYLNANANFNKNEITKIGKALEDYNKAIDAYFNTLGTSDRTGNSAKPFTKYEVGNSLSAIYGMKSWGIDPARGDEMYVKRDGTTTHIWSSTEQQCLGDSDPDVSGSFGINASWRNLSLYAVFSYQWGGQAYNQTYQQIENVDLKSYNGDRRILTERWKKYGDVTKLKDIADQSYTTHPTSRFVQDENELRFTSLTLDYSFNRDMISRWGLSNLRLQFNMGDIFVLSTVKQERGTSYPFARQFNLSLKASF